jgi:NAD(P)-dependent dehydrogenase (short-subunit alcohol dehydrogenase family)
MSIGHLILHCIGSRLFHLLRTVEAMGRIDVPVNAGGTNAPGTVEELDVEGWDRTFLREHQGALLLSKGPCLDTGDGSGTLINVSSMPGKRGRANAIACCASKFGFTGFTEALADGT